MKKLFYLSVLALIVYEVLNVYFIMPFPGSQRINSLDAAYFLYNWRWVFRVVFGLLILRGAFSAVRSSKWHLLAVVPLILISFLFNFQLSADRMFLEPRQIILKSAAVNTVNRDRQIIGVVEGGEARAYPIQFIAYHHKLQDTVGGKPILVTYCTVCRTGRVFEPLVEGKPTTFRLVGMDRFNAMIEDSATGSWWRQANGEAVEGELKGHILHEMDSTQTTLSQWVELHPDSLIMQADAESAAKYQSYAEYENGQGGELTGRNNASWQDKSWIVGIIVGKSAKAFDWNRLKAERIINDEVAGIPIVLVLANDDKSFFAFERPDENTTFTFENNQLISASSVYDLNGKSFGRTAVLKRLNAYQEFWHSWQTFHPDTENVNQ